MIQKFIATIIIISLILSVGFNIFLFKPKKAHALFGIFDITAANLVDDLKEWVLDEIPRRIARHMVLRLQNEIVRWAQGGYTDENKPFALLRWKDYLLEALDFASAKFIEDFHLTPICAPFRFTIGQSLGFAQPRYVYPPYRIYAACSINRVVDNVERFWRNPSISAYGWNVWSALSQPQNNIFGSVILAALRKSELENEEIKEKEVQKDTGQGYMNENECIDSQEMTDEQYQECQDNCFLDVDPNDIKAMDACLAGCDARNTGICLEYRTTNVGSTIHSSIEKALGSDIDWLITADEITQLFGLVFSSLFNKLYHGTGLAAQPYYRAAQTSVSKYQAQYGYYENYKRAQTPEDKQNLRRDVLDNILGAVQRATAKSYECDADYQLTGDFFQELSTQMIEEESQHLYVGYEGVDLKPDYEVLDPSNAPYVVFGTTWEEVPFSRYPEKCANVAGRSCSGIITNLPFELDKSNIRDGNCSGCLGRINELRQACTETRASCLAECPVNDAGCRQGCRATYTICENDAITTAVSEDRCQDFTYGNDCLNGAKLIDRTRKRCDVCVEDAQQRCENIENASERDSCIELYCSDYEDIEDDWGQTFTDAQDFYNRCQQVEIKDACLICLMEYFVPAKYCLIAADFVSRAFVKYPGLVRDDMWWGMFNDWTEGSGDDCAETWDPNESIYTGLLCRILPDYGSGGGGAGTYSFCKQWCDNPTDAELKNTYDDQPKDSECTGPMIAGEFNTASTIVGAFHPGGQIIPWLVRERTKCCAALTGHEPEMWDICRGTSGEVEELDCSGATINTKPWCYCNLGQRGFLSDFHNYSRSNPYECQESGCPPQGPQRRNTPTDCARACANRTFNVPSGVTDYVLQNLILKSNAATARGTIAVATDGCRGRRPNSCSNNIYPPEDQYACPYTAYAPSNVVPATIGGTNGECRIQTANRNASVGHCVDYNAGGVGGVTMHCDMRGHSSLTVSIYNETPEGGTTGVGFCLPCDPCDDDYPYYGSDYDQCNMKLQNDQIISQTRETCN